ncbi:MAG: UDP-N-acetylmuramate dehydrogenase [Candidatus Omnitrophica bacterium]|nr:UDP-N-acetylmuramate dehydrogenase [Candidatus Omnitrophota bacterium]
MKMDNKLCRQLTELCQGDSSKVLFNEPLSRHSTIGIGGRASVFFIPQSLEGLINVVNMLRSEGMRIIAIGNGSNILFPDGGLEAAIVNLSSPFFTSKKFTDETVYAGAGAGLSELISDCCRRGLGGLEGLVGIPGTVGGAVFSNASYKGAISDHLLSIKVLDEDGRTKWVERNKMEFGYRYSSITEKEIILEAAFTLKKDSEANLRSKLQEHFAEKTAKQPLHERTLGCIFKNPERYKSGEIIDRLGMKGLSCGGARVSTKHANFIVNTGGANSAEVIKLIDDIRDKAREEFPVELEPEIRIL